MININIVCVGKLKEKYLRDACAEYSKRLTAFCKLNIIELQPVALSLSPGEAEIDEALKREGKNILSKISDSAYVIAMCIEGKQMPSVELSKMIDDVALRGQSNVTFVIGGSFGLSNEVKERADFKLSMSQMTFPHQLARVMLLEQIYRAFQISNGGKYHK